MDINDELEKIEETIKGLENNTKLIKNAVDKEIQKIKDEANKKIQGIKDAIAPKINELQQRINKEKQRINEVLKRGREAGMLECEHCHKYSQRSDFAIIKKSETHVICTYQDIINSGGNEYAIVEDIKTYNKCPKCNKLFLVDSRRISEKGDYSRDSDAIRNFEPKSVIISSTEDPNIQRKNELITNLNEQQRIADSAKNNIERITRELGDL